MSGRECGFVLSVSIHITPRTTGSQILVYLPFSVLFWIYIAYIVRYLKIPVYSNYRSLKSFSKDLLDLKL